MRHAPALVVVVAVAATTAFAHSGVKNPAVMARMHAMQAIGQNAKTIGEMATGTRPFDAAAARAAAAAIAAQAARVPGLFQAPETDPKSEALPAIWANFGDFTARAKALQAEARAASGTISTPDSLRTALDRIGATCRSCHEAYRK